MTVKNNSSMEAKMMNAQLGESVRRIIVAGTIRDETAAYFLDQITLLEHLEVGTPINVYINSAGGQVDSALCMLDLMTTTSCPIKTIGIGQVSSAAVLLLACGTKGNRLISPNCRVMIHQVSTGLMGNSSELDNEVQEVLRIQEIYNKISLKVNNSGTIYIDHLYMVVIATKDINKDEEISISYGYNYWTEVNSF